MDFLLHRYRNVTVLVVAVLGQLLLLAFQVRNHSDIPLIRVWAVGAVSPMARVLDAGRVSASSFFHDYFILLGVREQNKRLQSELESVQLENQYLRTELGTADRGQALALFQKQTAMKTVAARIFMNSTAMNTTLTTSSVFVTAGSQQGIQSGMAVITPGGIVGKITNVYPQASLVLMMNDPAFAAGVVSQKHRVLGTLRGQGNGLMSVDLVENEQPVDVGEWFYTSGNDLIFPKGLRVGQATVVRPGKLRKEILVQPSGFESGPEEVLIVVEGVHMPIPADAPAEQTILLQPPPPQGTPQGGAAATGTSVPGHSGEVGTDADRVMDQLRAAKGQPKSAAAIQKP